MLTLPHAELRTLKPLLQRGVHARVRAGTSVRDFLVEDLGFTPEYVRRRVTTVFLDGQVVDSVDEALLRQGSRLALSGAMPGLVGATLRSGGPYAAMRAAITRAPEGAHDDRRAGATVEVEVKLFNLLLDEVGPALLERGVLVSRADAEALGARLDASAPGDDPVELRVRSA